MFKDDARIRIFFLIHFTVLEGIDTIIQDNPSIYTVKAFCLCLQVYSQKTWGSCGALDGLYYMSSSNVVFVCDTGRMFHTENKTLVPEWPTFTDVYSSY